MLLDALVNDRPAVCVLYDEGTPPGESWADQERDRRALPRVARSGAFHRAAGFEEVVVGIERASRAGRARGEGGGSRRGVGAVDGHAAERVVDAILAVVS